MRHRFKTVPALCAAGAILAGCSTAGSAGHTALPVAAMPQRSRAARTNGSQTIFVSSQQQSIVNGYDVTTGVQTESISDANGPTFLAVDTSGNLYVADRPTAQIGVYAHGATVPSLTLEVGHNFLGGVAVSSRGEVAVPAGQAVYFFKPGKTKPFRVVSSSLWNAIGIDVYDAKGNLYFSGTTRQGPRIGEIIGGGKGSAIVTFAATNLVAPQGVALDNSGHLLVVDSSTVYQYKLPNPTTPSASIELGTSSQPFYDGVAIALTEGDRAMYVSSGSEADRFFYPAGGAPTQIIPLRAIDDIAISSPAP